jgi:hypothetical protein
MHICYARSTVIRYRVLWDLCVNPPIWCNRRKSRGFGCLPTRNGQTEETVGFESAITWLTNAPRACGGGFAVGLSCCCPGSGDSVKRRRCRVQRSVRRSGSNMFDATSVFSDATKLCRERRVAMRTGLLEFGVTPWQIPSSDPGQRAAAARLTAPAPKAGRPRQPPSP